MVLNCCKMLVVIYFNLFNYGKSWIVVLLLRAPEGITLFLTCISICGIFACQDDFEHVYVCAAVSSLVI